MRTAFLFLLVVLSGTLSPKVSRAQVDVSIQGASLRVGDVVTIPIEITSVDGLDITSFQFTLHFPEDVLDITAVETSGTISEGKSVLVNLDQEGEIRVAMASTEALQGSGVLVNLSGIVKGEDLFSERIFTPRFEELLFFNSSASSVGASSAMGTYSVKGLDLTISFLGSSAGNTFSLPITAGQTTGLDIGGYQFTVKYDSSVVSFSGATTNNSLTAPGEVIFNGNEEDRIFIGYAGTEPLEGAGNLLFLNGTRKTNADPKLRLANVRFFDLDGQYIPAAPDGFEAKISDLMAPPGQNDTLSVLLEGLDDLLIDAYQFTLNYNPSIINITGTSTNETLSRGKAIITNANTPGQVSVAWAGSSPLKGNGALVNLNVEVLAGGDPGIQFVDYKLVGDVGNGTDGPLTFPDLVIDDLALNPSTVVAGEDVEIQFLVRNQGDGDAPAFQTNVRLNTSATEVSTEDALLYFCELTGLEAGAQSEDCTSSIAIPPDLAAGQYYIWVITDVNGEAGQLDETNDFAQIPLQVLGVRSALINPVSNPRVNQLYANYWDVTDDGNYEFHSGIDFGTTGNDLNIVAAAKGRVRTIPEGTYASPDNHGMGNVVVIDHTAELGVYTVYAHLESIIAVNGQQVEAGDTIGIMGSTGLSIGPTGVHLHFEVKDRGVMSGGIFDESEPWGYTGIDSIFVADRRPYLPGHPNKYGFHDPMIFLNNPVELMEAAIPIQVVVEGEPIKTSPVEADSVIMARSPVLGNNENAAYVAVRKIGDAWYNVHIPNREDEGWSASGWIRGTQSGSVFAEPNTSLEYVQVANESIAIYDSNDMSSARVGFAYAGLLTLPQQFVVLESNADWYRIALPDYMSDGDGWVRAEDVLPATTSVDIAEEEHALPKSTSLGVNYPNPFAGVTNIPIHIETQSLASLRVYDMLGREVALLLDEQAIQGEHIVQFDASHLPSGMYMLVMHVGESMYRQFLTVLR